MLSPLVLRERNNFMLLGNLGSAYQASGQYGRAAEYLQQVQDIWPREWPGLSKEQLAWYQELEQSQLRLVKKRYRESLKRTANQGSTRRPSGMEDSVDDLFDNAQGPLQYKATMELTGLGGAGGNTSTRSFSLNGWQSCSNSCCGFRTTPGSTGSLVSSTARTKTWRRRRPFLHECIWTRRYDVPRLQEHRKIVEAGVPKQSGPVLEDMTFKAESKPPADTGAWLPERRQIFLVGGVAGTIALALIYLQIREFRHRRR